MSPLLCQVQCTDCNARQCNNVHKCNTFSTDVIAAPYYKCNTLFPTNVITIAFEGIYYVCWEVKIFIAITSHKIQLLTLRSTITQWTPPPHSFLF